MRGYSFYRLIMSSNSIVDVIFIFISKCPKIPLDHIIGIDDRRQIDGWVIVISSFQACEAAWTPVANPNSTFVF